MDSFSGLAILHGTDPSRATLIGAGGPGKSFFWQTCMRTVAFYLSCNAPDQMRRVAQDLSVDAHFGGGAVRVLVEIVSGMNSPNLGETEVQHQFTNFLKENPGATELQQLGKLILQEANFVRAKYFRGIGGRSYGSFLRKELVGIGDVVLIGNGMLAQSLLPWLNEHRVVIVSRTRPLSTVFCRFGIAAIIAAPIDLDSLNLQFGKTVFHYCSKIFDFRGGETAPGILCSPNCKIFNLDRIHSEILEREEVALSALEGARFYLKEKYY